MMSWIEGFQFAHPLYFLLLLLLPLVWWLLRRRKGSPAVGYSSLAGLKGLGKARSGIDGWLAQTLLQLALIFLVAAMARPQSGKSFTRVKASGVDIMLVLDVSGSMLAEDFTIGSQRASRVAAVREVTEEFIEARPNDRMGIYAFAGKPFLVSPLTLDHDWLQRNLVRVEVGMVVDGTAIGSAIAASANRLKDRKSESRIMVLLTDGTNTAGRVTPQTAAEAAAALGIRIYAIGAGTLGQAPY
ncbi:MAG: VWA domain-containing protein, partial [Verrucomicrobiota bacterium]